MSKIYIRTYAYNAEKTLRRAVDSILNQTYGDFVYYLCDNGSTDATGDIIREYAAKDSRIRPFFNQVNRGYMETEECLFLPTRMNDDDYFCTLDADDEYYPTFLEEMLHFMDRNHLDVAACGTDFLDADNDNIQTGSRGLTEDLILEGQAFGDLLYGYYGFLRTVWGKMYKGWVAHSMLQDSTDPRFAPYKAYGGDTYNVMRAFKTANRVGILAKSLHKYYRSTKSVSYKLKPERIDVDEILFEEGLRYLTHYGLVSQFDMDFLLSVYMYAVADTFQVLVKSQLSTEEQLDYLYKIFTKKTAQSLAARDFIAYQLAFDTVEEVLKMRQELFNVAAEYLMGMQEIKDESVEKYCQLGEFVSAAASNAAAWLSFKKIWLKFLLYQNRIPEAQSKWEELAPLLSRDDPDWEYLQSQLQSGRGD